MSIHEKLFKLQSEAGAISKDSTNPFFNSKYFDINALLRQIHPLLSEHKLLLLQPIDGEKVKSIIVDVESGDSVESSINLPDIGDPQKMGSAVTYYRRYTLQSLLALQAEDDDGNAARKPSLAPGDERWVKAVHAVASGKTDINSVKKSCKITPKNAERLVAEAMEHSNG